MKKIALVGYFGWGNFGDELFIKTHEQHLGKDYDLRIANDLLGEPYFSRPVHEIVDEVDGVLIGGGDLLNPVRVSSLYWRKEWLDKPVFILGLGVPNQPFERKPVLDEYRAFLNHPNCKFIGVRDVESFEWVRDNLGVPEDKLQWFPDPVCSMHRPAPVDNGADKVLGVVMREHRSLNQDMGPVRELIDSAKSLDYRIKHLVLATKSLGELDRDRAELIREEDEDIVFSDDLDELCANIGGCAALASIKFHGLIVATMYGVPTIAMSVTPKNRNFLRMIERPEMLASYTSPSLAGHLGRYPARIHQKVRGWLYRESSKGYVHLKKAMSDAL